MGVNRMKMSPGIVISSEKAKNHLRLLIRSNTASLATERAPAGWSGGELGIGHAVEAGLSGPILGHDDSQDAAGDRDRGEHRGQHADDQDERKALDDRRAEEVQDRGGDEARHVRVED